MSELQGAAKSAGATSGRKVLAGGARTQQVAWELWIGRVEEDRFYEASHSFRDEEDYPYAEPDYPLAGHPVPSFLGGLSMNNGDVWTPRCPKCGKGTPVLAP